MKFSATFLKEIVERRTEGLAVELKAWFDPTSAEGVARIAKTCIAMRNNNGGYLLVGFDNKTSKPDLTNAPGNPRETFHQDRIQGIVSKYAAELFEVEVHFVEFEAREYPVICVPGGVRTPVFTKSGLKDSTGKVLIKEHNVYVRTLNANHTPSTSEARFADWESLIQICFDNREADIARFLKRHFSESKNTLESLSSLVRPQNLDASETPTQPGPAPETPQPSIGRSLEEQAIQFSNEGLQRFGALVTERTTKPPECGYWEATLIISGPIQESSANREFLNLISSSNPNYTGWPIWLDSRGFRDTESHPHVFNGAWEALMISVGQGWLTHVDFWRIHPRGWFYHRRALEDDLPRTERHPKPLTLFDFGIPLWRVGEAIAVGLSFAKALGCPPETGQLYFRFKWTGLRGRQLASWAEPARYISAGQASHQDEIESTIIVPANLPIASIPESVYKVTQPLYEIFNGFALGKDTVEQIVMKMLNRRW